ncbi:MAG TPA: DUF3857 domain-containing protein [Mucilaginibacter sp.]|nr:DUF3857 domain-containing protein [Mucilaginibacter sp.]
MILLFNNHSIAATPEIHTAAKPTWISTYKDYNQKPSLRTIQDGYYYSLSEQQIHVEKKAQYFHYMREIISATGIQNGSQISVSFDPAFERLDFHEIIVWRNNKPQNRLNLSAFKILADEQDLSKFIYQGTYSANLILDDIRKGDRIEYSFTITGRNPIFDNKFCQDIYLQSSKPMAHQYVSLFFSPSRKLNMKLFNKAAKPVVTQENGLTHYVWEGFQVQPAVDNNNEPAWFNNYNHVQLSDFSNWAEVINWASGINQPATDIKEELGRLVGQLKSKFGNDKAAYFRAATRTVQDEVRCMGIEIGEYSHRANRPEKVYAQRYGDCKDKSLLLVSILRANGIDANMVLVNTGLEDKIDQFIPTANAFDHAVVTANVNGKQVWVDATISNQGGDGTDIYFPGYGKGLILKPGNAALTTIPMSKTGKTVCVETYVVGKRDSNVRLEVHTTYTLDRADRERDQLESSGMAETEKSYLDYYSKIYSKIESTDSVKVIDDVHKNILTTIESYSIGDLYKKDTVSGRANAEFYASYIGDELPTIAAHVKTPVAVSFPFNYDYTIKIVDENGWRIPDAHNEIKRNAYQFLSDYSVTEDTLALHYQFAYLKDYVAAERVEEFKNDINQLKNGDLSYSVGYGMSNAPFVANGWMIVGACLIIVLMGYIGFRIFKTETPGIVFTEGASFTPIGGWLIIVMIGLGGTAIGVVMELINGHYFAVSKWNTFMTGSNSVEFRGLLIYRVTGYVFICCYAVFCFILMLKRRDILPRYIVGFYISVPVFFVLSYILALGFNFNTENLQLPMVRAIIFAGVWISYFKRSIRVEQTFIVPYPAHNYSFEEHEVQNQ